MNRVRYRHPGMHFRPVAWICTDAECAFHEMNPFFHADEPQPRRGNSVRIRRKSLSIVPDAHTHALRRAQESDQHLRCFGMFVDVLEAFLCHTVQTGGGVDRKGLRNVSPHIPDRQSRAPSEFVDMVSNGRLQTEMFKQRGMQLVGKGLGVMSQLSGGLSKMLKVTSQRRVRRERTFERTDIDGQDGQPLCKIIVQLARKPLSLALLSRQQLRGQLLELGFMPAQQVFSLFPFGDVFFRSDQADGLACFVPERDAAV